MSLHPDPHIALAPEGGDSQSLRAALSAKDEFLATVAHELRSPLGAILGWAHMLRQHGSGEEFERGLDVIEQSVQMQARLIDDLMDMSRMTSGSIQLRPKVLEPRTVIDSAVEAVRPAADEKKIRLRKVLDLGAGPVRGDASRLQQVFCNLLHNAVKFTPEGGDIEIALRAAPADAVISVRDSGEGIPPEYLGVVFDRYRQGPSGRALGGLGLGLAIARHIVVLHGGEIRVESEGEGRGATFTVMLPLERHS